MNDFKHSQYAHCESGVLSTLLSNNGLTMSEPMVFGITSSLSFFYFPIIKLNNMPLISYREIPHNMIKKLPKLLNFKMLTKRYANPQDAKEDLDLHLKNGNLVGLQTSVFYLPYFPKDMRFHFNAHNLLVCEKQGENYVISDPVFEDLSICDEKSLSKARFAKGVFAPKGFLYFPQNLPSDLDLGPIIKKAIIKNSKRMLTPFPYGGVKGMRKLAKKINSFGKNTDKRYLVNFLTHIVRMQEEIGTGGGGFRFLYSAFLDEAKAYDLNQEKLTSASELLTSSGDKLREFALLCVKNCKNIDSFDPTSLTQTLNEVANLEKEAFGILKDID